MNDIKIDSLHIYPVKSCGGIDLTEAAFTPTGFEWDRRWVLVDEHEKLVSQRDPWARKLALIETEITRNDLVISAQGMRDLLIDLAEPPHIAEHTISIHGRDAYAYADRAEASEWFSKYLEHQVTLVRMNLEHGRVVDPFYVGDNKLTASGQDGFPYLLTTQESLAQVNNWLKEQGLPTVRMDRFRPNIVISGLPAFDEDNSASLRAPNGAEILPVKPCGRCAIIGVDQQSGVYDGKSSPIVPLSKHHRFANARGETNAMFGVNSVVHEEDWGKKIQIGDSLDLITKPGP